MIRAKSAEPSRAKAGARKARTKPVARSAARTPSRSSGPVAETDDDLNPGLVGADDRRDAGEAARASVEDPLRDWPEDAAPEDDEWLLERGGQGIQKLQE